jgi:hypothetical protein
MKVIETARIIAVRISVLFEPPDRSTGAYFY